ncbi:oligosaccharide flippase family protein [Flavobacteriaceae bacterium XHP0103]|uniref:lipopolysaccharide biosynthesis protein n=1 Tax=Marixanthotalea marina TaxID=2844359 RepID=UPI002989B20C|nr:oligosaccharide flippase family protein [Marixanthotalea marina]MBU3820689.1 oligosaccharide flippase family protein [Marixanthotalea marina]
MNVLKKFFKDTVIYGLATVLPRLMNFLLVPLHTDKLQTTSYSDNTTFYVYAAFFNVLLTYGMETAFFRFFNKSEQKGKVFSTVFISLISTTVLFLIGVLIFSQHLATWLNIAPKYLKILLGLLVLDTLVVAPFAYLRATGRPIKFAAIKISNILIYVILNYFFLWAIPYFQFNFLWFDNTDLVYYIFVANLIASMVTFLLLLPYFFKTKIKFSISILKQLLNYGWPIMVAGLAYVINDNFDKWILPYLLNKDINGAYSACYKIAMFMTIFIQAFRLGAEPFFFSHATKENAKETYALIMKFFVIAGSFMLVFIVSYLDFFKSILVKDASYWEAITIVPIVLLANLCLGIYFNLAIWYKLTDKTIYGMYFSVVGAIITIALNLILIEKIGFIAAAWATLAAYGSMMVLSYFFGQRHYPVPYNLKQILFYLVISIGLSIVAINTNANYYINTVLVLVFLGIIIISEKKQLKQLINR